VVLEIDHVVPRAEGGTDDEINLVASCWECNRGKSSVPLGQVMTGEDPHDRAVMLLEKERQLREYNAVLAQIRERREVEVGELASYWHARTGWYFTSRDEICVLGMLETFPFEQFKWAINEAVRYGKVSGFGYVVAVLNNSKRQG
jgi:hypothetical protein